MTKGAKELRSDSQSDFEDAQEPSRSNMLHLTEGLVPKFSGQDKAYTATRWIQDIEDNAEIFGWTAVQQLLVARRALCGTAELWFRSEKTCKTWDDLKANIAKEFPDTIDAKTIHEMMSARKKKDSESCLDYMFCMKELGKRGKLADYVAIKYIIEGVRDNELNKIMLYGVTTYSDLKEKLKIYEQLRENLRSSSTPRPGEPKDERKSERSVRCYSCGELNHTSVDCPHKEKGVKCFRCNGFGHISSKCTVAPQGKASTSTSSTSGTSGATTSHNVKRSFLAQKQNDDKSIPDGSGEVGNTTDMADELSTDSCQLSVSSDFNVNTGAVIERDMKLTKDTKPITNVYVSGRNIDALVDSGSDVNLVSLSLFSELSAPILSKSDIYLSGLGDSRVRCKGITELNIRIDGEDYDGISFYVVDRDTMPYNMLLGQDFLQNCVMYMQSSEVVLKPVTKWVYQICVSDSVVGNEVSVATQQAAKQMMESYIPTKTKEAPIKLTIVLKDDRPVVHHPRRLALTEHDTGNEQVAKWLEEKIIRM